MCFVRRRRKYKNVEGALSRALSLASSRLEESCTPILCLSAPDEPLTLYLFSDNDSFYHWLASVELPACIRAGGRVVEARAWSRWPFIRSDCANRSKYTQRAMSRCWLAEVSKSRRLGGDHGGRRRWSKQMTSDGALQWDCFSCIEQPPPPTCPVSPTNLCLLNCTIMCTGLQLYAPSASNSESDLGAQRVNEIPP